MKLSKKVVIISVAVLVLLIGGGVVYAMNTPTARADRQLNLGNKYLQEGKYQEAILAFQEVINIEPKNIPARLGLGKAYVATKEFAKAEALLKEVIGIDKNNIPARQELFNVYMNENKLDDANAILKEMTTIDPKVDTKQLNADLNSAKAISASKASYDQGVKQMGDKQYLKAVDSFQKVIKEDTERYADAQNKIVDCKKSFVDTTLQKAKDAASNEDYQIALDILDQVLKFDPNNQDAMNLKSDYEKVIADKKAAEEKAKAKADQIAATKASVPQKLLSPEEAVQLVSARCYKNSPDVGFSYSSDPTIHNGVECYQVRSYSKQMRAAGGTGTMEIYYVEINTGRIWTWGGEITR